MAVRCSAVSVHPCGRREHYDDVDLTPQDVGSSLRAQGTLFSGFCGTALCRFIPAGAGNTERYLKPRLVMAVHPCGRREHWPATSWPQPEPGSSLRAQGTHSEQSDRTGKKRFIPAGAGNTESPQATGNGSTVHPCGRREHD